MGITLVSQLEVACYALPTLLYTSSEDYHCDTTGASAVDGFFTTDSYRFGCPPTGNYMN